MQADNLSQSQYLDLVSEACKKYSKGAELTKTSIPLDLLAFWHATGIKPDVVVDWIISLSQMPDGITASDSWKHQLKSLLMPSCPNVGSLHEVQMLLWSLVQQLTPEEAYSVASLYLGWSWGSSKKKPKPGDKLLTLESGALVVLQIMPSEGEYPTAQDMSAIQQIKLGESIYDVQVHPHLKQAEWSDNIIMHGLDFSIDGFIPAKDQYEAAKKLEKAKKFAEHYGMGEKKFSELVEQGSLNPYAYKYADVGKFHKATPPMKNENWKELIEKAGLGKGIKPGPFNPILAKPGVGKTVFHTDFAKVEEHVLKHYGADLGLDLTPELLNDIVDQNKQAAYAVPVDNIWWNPKTAAVWMSHKAASTKDCQQLKNMSPEYLGQTYASNYAFNQPRIVRIEISGAVGIGKTTVGKIIARAMTLIGWDVVFKNQVCKVSEQALLNQNKFEKNTLLIVERDSVQPKTHFY